MNHFLRLRPILPSTILGCITFYSYSALASCPTTEQALPTAAECIDLVKPLMNKTNRGVGQAVPNEISMMALNIASCGDVLETRYIPSSAMLPTLQPKDQFFVEKTAYCSKSPKRGDIILFHPNETLKNLFAPNIDYQEIFIKRVIGLPGETVEVKRGKVYVNGKPLVEPYILEPPQYQQAPTKVPKNQYFVLGDNRNNSNDSHIWGFVSKDLIIGKAIYRWFPVNRAGWLSNR